MRRICRSCSVSAPTSNRARWSATRAMPARPTGKRRATVAPSRSFRTRPMRQVGPSALPKQSTRDVPGSSRPSANSSASSGSRYAARRPAATSPRSSLSPRASSCSNPSTRPSPGFVLRDCASTTFGAVGDAVPAGTKWRSGHDGYPVRHAVVTTTLYRFASAGRPRLDQGDWWHNREAIEIFGYATEPTIFASNSPYPRNYDQRCCLCTSFVVAAAVSRKSFAAA